MTTKAEAAAETVKARSEKARVAREDAHWGRHCQGCDQERRRVEVGGVLVEHNRYDHATRSMVPCEGSSRPPQQTEDPNPRFDTGE